MVAWQRRVAGADQFRSAPIHRSESPTGYSSAGCSPAEPATASPVADNSTSNPGPARQSNCAAQSHCRDPVQVTLVPVTHRVSSLLCTQGDISILRRHSIIGLSIVPPGRAIVLAYTMPLWAIPLGLGLSREVLSSGKLAGVTIGFAGLVLFMNPALIDWRDPRAVAGNLLLLLTAICWAAGSCLYQRHPWQSNFWAQTFWQLAVGAVTIIALAVVLEPDWSVDWSPGFVAILVYNWVVTTALGYLLWNKVLAMMSPVMAGQVLTLTPISGFFLSTMIFGGAVTVDVVASILLIAIGLVLTL